MNKRTIRAALLAAFALSVVSLYAQESDALRELKHSTYSFTFNQNEEGWTKSLNVPGFDACTGGYEPNSQGISLTPGSNTNSFAYYESPLFDLFNPPSAKSERGVADRLFRGIISISNPSTEPMLLPTIRLRASTEDFQQTSAIIINSTGNPAGLPLKNGSILYRVWLYLPPGKDTVRLDYDILNFDPSDAPHPKVILTDAGISGVDPLQFGEPDETLTYDFTAGTHGFTQRSVPSTFAVPEFLQSGTKGIGFHRDPNRPGDAPSTDFGFWGKENIMTIYGDSIYKLSWTVESDAAPDEKTKVPVFRMRLNTGSLQFGDFLSVDSRDSESIVPTLGNPVTYEQWYRPHELVESDTLILSFDLIATGLEDEDPTVPIYLSGVTINRYIF
ncbi:MAG: hypothetical protein ABI579_09495 [Candidatus Sumerlaeota bacterium]